LIQIRFIHWRIVILCPKNVDCQNINERVLTLLPTESRTYYSVDSIVLKDGREDTEQQHRFPIEFLHQQTPSGMPPHALILKVGAIVMLLRNLKRNLCYGTRLIVRGMHERFLDLEVLTGSNKGERIFLPRIDLAPSDSHLPFCLKRRQFPICLAFAITINKSQGQTFGIVGLYLKEAVFSHGQLYVAFSRVRSGNNLKVKVVHGKDKGNLLPGSERVFTKNVVFKEVLHETEQQSSTHTSRAMANSASNSPLPTPHNPYTEYDEPDPNMIFHTEDEHELQNIQLGYEDTNFDTATQDEELYDICFDIEQAQSVAVDAPAYHNHEEDFGQDPETAPHLNSISSWYVGELEPENFEFDQGMYADPYQFDGNGNLMQPYLQQFQ
jgi:hypothetical protein